jgi:poly(hydroxyalkanoate) granule-associated protein
MAKRKTAQHVPHEVKESTQKIWLAGLGALSSAEEQGSKLFKNLVKKGEAYEKKAMGALGDLKQQVGKMTDEAQKSATKAWEKVEGVWDDRVAGTLQRIGVPSKDEISNLTKKVEDLTELVEAKSRRARVRRTAKARKVAAAHRSR